jgi:Domain of unknown function (DUF4288)
MNWYLGKLVFRIICGEGEHTPQFDEQLRLISATNEEVAFAKAVIIGEREQDGFYNQEQKLVQWKFIDVAELYKLSGLLDGAEFYSRIQESDDPDRYIELTHKKAAHIRQDSTHKFLELL